MALHQHGLFNGIIALLPATATPARCSWIMVTWWTWPICYLPRVRIRTIRNGGAVQLKLHRPDEQWDSPRDCREKQSPNARPYNRNRVSLNRAREGKKARGKCSLIGLGSSRLESTNHLYMVVQRCIIPQLLLSRDSTTTILGKQFLFRFVVNNKDGKKLQ